MTRLCCLKFVAGIAVLLFGYAGPFAAAGPPARSNRTTQVQQARIRPARALAAGCVATHVLVPIAPEDPDSPALDADTPLQARSTADETCVVSGPTSVTSPEEPAKVASFARPPPPSPFPFTN